VPVYRYNNTNTRSLGTNINTILFKMKYIIAAAALITAVAAVPPPPPTCEFGTYRCSPDKKGIEICDVTNNWVEVGPCPNGTSCSYLPQNGFELPFCTNNPDPKASNKREAEAEADGRGGLKPGDSCPTPGRYDCLGWGGIQVCDVTNIERFVGWCPQDSHCAYLNGIPYCVQNGVAKH
jgi:hypothetical protein